eukprot:scaffold114352_cov78-Phaeocystis_antarctica.AAC.1
MPLAVCFQILVTRLASQQLDPFASSRPLLHTRPPSDAVLRRWCAAPPPRPRPEPRSARRGTITLKPRNKYAVCGQSSLATVLVNSPLVMNLEFTPPWSVSSAHITLYF